MLGNDANDRRSDLHRSLAEWFARHRRDLPWRRDRDAYRVWISEAMLQQTRVETVIPYYERFLARFPDVRALARAELDDVLAAWSGLGYYRRARMLREAARAIVERHGGEFPRDRAALEELPGVGPYTAGAIASLAFDASEALVDGNVARVLSRLFAIDGDPSSKATRTELWARARASLPERGAGGWNEALMELGALVCTPRDPRCDACPFARACAALRDGRVSELPRAKLRPDAVPVELEILIVVDHGRWLLERRPARGRMAGLWQLPTIEVAPRADDRAPFTSTEGRLFPTRWPVASTGDSTALFRSEEPCGSISHTITHHRIRAAVRRGVLAVREPREPYEWVPEAELFERALTGMTRKVLRADFARALDGPSARERTRAVRRA